MIPEGTCSTLYIYIYNLFGTIHVFGPPPHQLSRRCWNYSSSWQTNACYLRSVSWPGEVTIFPIYTSKYLLSFGVLGLLLGSKYLLRRCLDVYGLVVFSPRSLDSFDIQHLSNKLLSCAFDAKLLNGVGLVLKVGGIGMTLVKCSPPNHAFLSRIETIHKRVN